MAPISSHHTGGSWREERNSKFVLSRWRDWKGAVGHGEAVVKTEDKPVLTC